MVEFKVGDEVEYIDDGERCIVIDVNNDGITVKQKRYGLCTEEPDDLKLIRRDGMKYELGQKFKKNGYVDMEIIEVNNGFYHLRYVSMGGGVEHYTDKQLERWKPITPESDLVTIKMSRSSAEQKGITGFIEEDV